MTTEVTLDLNEGLATEEIVILDDFVDEPQGAWPKGWYPGIVLEGFQTKKGRIIQTSDSLSKKGDSRNLTLCLSVTNGKDQRTLITTINYRASDFHPDRQSFVKEAREENKGVKGAWADRDAQRSNLALVAINGLSKAVGFAPKLAEGGLVAGIYVGQHVDVYLGTDDKGFNEAKNFAAAGSKIGVKPNGKAQ